MSYESNFYYLIGNIELIFYNKLHKAFSIVNFKNSFKPNAINRWKDEGVEEERNKNKKKIIWMIDKI